MVRHQKEVAAIVAQDPNVAGFTSNIGQGPGGSGGALNTGRIGVDLKPRDAARAVGRSGHRVRCVRSSRRCPACACSW